MKISSTRSFFCFFFEEMPANGISSLMLLAIFLIAAAETMAQSFAFDHLTINEGLSNNTVYAIEEDADGFIWMGTRDGLNRYDGYEFKKFDKSSPLSSFPSNHVQELFNHPNGDLWIGLQSGGIVIYDREKQAFDTNPFPDKGFNSWSNVSVTTIFEDSKGFIWIGTAQEGIVRFDASLSEYEYFGVDIDNQKRKLLSNTCFSFTEDGQGRIWMGTSGNAIQYYDYRSDSVFVVEGSVKEGFDLTSYSKSMLYYNRKLWIGTQGNGLVLYDTDKGEFIGHHLDKKLIKDVACFNNNVYIATDGDGLYITGDEGLSFQHFTYRPSLTNSLNTNALYDIFFDKLGNLWLGTFNGGINYHKVNKTAFYSFSDEAGMAYVPGNQSVLTFLEDSRHNVWIGKDGGGLMRFNRDSLNFKQFSAENIVEKTALSSNVVTSIYEDSKGNLWVGTFINGLNLFNPKTGQSTIFKNNPTDSTTISNNNIWAITEDAYNNLWVGTLGGGLHLFDADAGTFKNYSPDPEFPDRPDWISDRNIRALLPDENGNLWIATEYGGLNFLDIKKGTFKVWKYDEYNPGSISGNSILCLLLDSKKRLWIGTEGDGLNCLEGTTDSFIHYSIHQGFPSNVINSIQEDEIGNLWISTNQGLVLFNPESEELIIFDKNDGLQSNQFNPGASLKTEDGWLFFGGINGFNFFVPAMVKRNPDTPRIVFTDFKLFNHSVPVGESNGKTILSKPLNENPTVCLAYSDNVFSISFAALDFTNPHKNRYVYRMLGFDESWNEVGSAQRSVSYTNLDAGSYVFQVKASNNNGVWNETPANIKFIIEPPFWQTWWFRAMLFIVIIGLIGGYFVYLDNKRQAAHKEKLLRAEQEILKLKNVRLSEEVKQKNAQLSAAILQSAHKNKSLDLLKKELVDLGKDSLADQTQKKEVRRIIRKIDSELSSEDYWEQFQLNFDQVHQQFSKRILQLHPNLTPNDIRLSCLLRINLSNKEIASIQNVSLGAVEKSKFRLKKKLNLPSEIDLNSYILNVS